MEDQPRPPGPTLAEFYDAMCRHNWYYMYSDDPGEQRRGGATDDAIKDVSAIMGGEYTELYLAFAQALRDGEPRPPRPEEG